MKPGLFACCSLMLFLCASAGAALAQDAAGSTGTNNSPQNAPIPSVIHLIPPKIGQGMLRTNHDLYRLGQAVQITFTIRNASHKPIGYDYPTAQQFDITVNNAQGKMVWDWAAGRKFANVIKHLTLKPGQSHTYRVTWNGHRANGQAVTGGAYTINARMTSSNRPAVTGNLVVNTDTDPTNMGVPTRTPAENGVVRHQFLTPPMTASKTIHIGGASAK